MGLTRIRAEQISDIDYKQAVRVVQTSNITLAGGAPSSVDGVNLSVNDRVLVTGQNTGSQNGLYRVQAVGTGSNGTWVRTSDGNTQGEIESGMIVMVTEGEVYKDTLWKLITNNPITLGSTSLTFELNTEFGFGNIYANGTSVIATVQSDVLTLTAGSNMTIAGNATSKTITFSSTGGGGGGNTDFTNVQSNIIPSANLTYSLGNSTNQWANIYVGGNTIFLGNLQLKDNGANTLGVYAANGTTPANISASINGANITGTVGLAQYVTQGAQGNITSVGTLSSLSVTGNINGGNIIATGSIQGSNIDSVNADLAEKYLADGNYKPGTVVVFGGNKEITQSTKYADPRVAGVISTAPAYCMNAESDGLPVALQGRVPCRVIGNISKGDLITASDIPGVAMKLDPQDWIPGSVIGKALGDHSSSDEGMIEVVIGRV